MKYDEVEQTGLSPTAKSSPDEALSDVVPETPVSNVQVKSQSDGIKRWLTDELDKMTPNAQMPVESCSNSYIASDVEDGNTDGTPLEVKNLHPPQNSSSFIFTKTIMELLNAWHYLLRSLLVDL